MNGLCAYTFACGDISFVVYKRSEADAWDAAESTPLIAVSPARLELVEVTPHDPGDEDGAED